jgi:hypothetical protein
VLVVLQSLTQLQVLPFITQAAVAEQELTGLVVQILVAWEVELRQLLKKAEQVTVVQVVMEHRLLLLLAVLQIREAVQVLLTHRQQQLQEVQV